MCSLVPKIPKLRRPLATRYIKPMIHRGPCGSILPDKKQFRLMPPNLTGAAKIGHKQYKLLFHRLFVVVVVVCRCGCWPPRLHLCLLGSIWASWAPFGPRGLHLGLLSFIWASWARLIAQLIARLIAHCYALYYELLHELLHAEWLGLAWLGLARLG